MKKLVYYLVILYLLSFVGTTFSFFIKDISFFKKIISLWHIAIWNILFAVPYGFSLVFLVASMYYNNEIKGRKTYISCFFAIITGFASILTYSLISLQLRNYKSNNITLWNTLSFSEEPLFDFWKLFLIGIFLSTLLLIPIHNYFRKKFDFLNEVK